MQIGSMPSIGCLYDETLENYSAEEVYDVILSRLKKNNGYQTFRGAGMGDIIDQGYDQSRIPPTSLDDFCKSALRSGLEFHDISRGYIPSGLVEEIRALSVPPIPWDVKLAKWFDTYFAPVEKQRTYARPSRRQSSTPDIPRPGWITSEISADSRNIRCYNRYIRFDVIKNDRLCTRRSCKLFDTKRRRTCACSIL